MAQKVFHEADFQAMPKLYRTHFFNSLVGFKSVNLVGSISAEGQHNLAVFSQVFHLGARPALIGMIVRPAVVPRHTLTNIRATNHFTLNHIKAEFCEQAHQTSAKYPEDVSEFEAVGLTPYFSSNHVAPYVKESAVKIGLKLAYEQHIPLNDTILIVGQVTEVILNENIVKGDGYLDLATAGTITCTGLDAYHTVNKLYRLNYARPDLAAKQLDNNLFF